MGSKRKSSPPPAAKSSTSDEDSSSDEEQAVAQPTPSSFLNAKRTERDDDESDSDSGSESDPDPPTKTLYTPKKPSESEDSSDEEDEDDEEEPEKPKSPAKESESKPDKKKLKLSGPDQSPSKKSSSIPSRIWSPEDEVTLLKALSEYHARHGKIPAQRDYPSFISGISGSIGFPVTEKQLFNKVRQLKHTYNQNIKKGTDVNISNPRRMAVFEMSKRLFGGSNKPLKKHVKLEANRDVGTESSGGVANGGVSNGGAMARSESPYFYLRALIEDLSGTKNNLGWLSTVDVVAHIGESKARDLDAKTKMLRVDAIKLCAREDKLKAELLGTLAEEMEDD